MSSRFILDTVAPIGVSMIVIALVYMCIVTLAGIYHSKMDTLAVTVGILGCIIFLIGIVTAI